MSKTQFLYDALLLILCSAILYINKSSNCRVLYMSAWCFVNINDLQNINWHTSD